MQVEFWQRSTLYPVTPVLSDEADQETVTCELETGETLSEPGAEGALVSDGAGVGVGVGVGGGVVGYGVGVGVPESLISSLVITQGSFNTSAVLLL